jgi:formylglycine-generating enzyme required for sulfatase activity
LEAALGQDRQLDARQRAQAGDVLAQLGDPRFREDAWYLPAKPPLGFVEVPTGPFLMGSDKKQDPQADDDELRQHEVFLERYYIACYPVTHAQYWAFVQGTGHRSPTAEVESERSYEWRDGKPPTHLLSHPVVLVTWHDACAYCEWLTEELRASKETPETLAALLRQEKWRVRLPSEAEWEKAARGSLTGSGGGRIYPWEGDADPNRANYGDTGIGTTSSVGCFPGGASPYGCQDMSGNVWEWTSTLYKDYPYNPNDGREDPAAADARVLRGGAFYLSERYVRCAYRNTHRPVDWHRLGGFRVVVAPGFPL